MLYNPDENVNMESGTLNDPLEFERSMLFFEICQLSPEEKSEFLQSEQCSLLEQRGLIGRKTKVYLSKNDDVERRAGMATILIAKDKNDPLFMQLSKVREKERDILHKLDNKYATQAITLAKSNQRTYLRNRNRHR